MELKCNTNRADGCLQQPSDSAVPYDSLELLQASLELPSSGLQAASGVCMRCTCSYGTPKHSAGQWPAAELQELPADHSNGVYWSGLCSLAEPSKCSELRHTCASCINGNTCSQIATGIFRDRSETQWMACDSGMQPVYSIHENLSGLHTSQIDDTVVALCENTRSVNETFRTPVNNLILHMSARIHQAIFVCELLAGDSGALRDHSIREVHAICTPRISVSAYNLDVADTCNESGSERQHWLWEHRQQQHRLRQHPLRQHQLRQHQLRQQQLQHHLLQHHHLYPHSSIRFNEPNLRGSEQLGLERQSTQAPSDQRCLNRTQVDKQQQRTQQQPKLQRHHLRHHQCQQQDQLHHVVSPGHPTTGRHHATPTPNPDNHTHPRYTSMRLVGLAKKDAAAAANKAYTSHWDTFKGTRTAPNMSSEAPLIHPWLTLGFCTATGDSQIALQGSQISSTRSPSKDREGSQKSKFCIRACPQPRSLSRGPERACPPPQVLTRKRFVLV